MIVYRPATAKTASCTLPSSVRPSPRSNCDRVTPTSSLDARASRWIESGASPASGVAVKDARGACASRAGAATAIVVCARSALPAASRTVSVITNDPAEANR
ncbi:MAG: hypothetical protein E6J88_06355 [Deltaproteobacteria bacterium]|nr:MAG: hypothetical protein E6J88_06355 [Deltaproteobacteria bacterium]